MLFVGLDPGHAQIVVAAQVDVVVGRILVVVDQLEVLVRRAPEAPGTPFPGPPATVSAASYAEKW